MFYSEERAIQASEEEPSLIFDLLKEDHIELLDTILSKKGFDINVTDESGNQILTRLLKRGYYDLVLKHMKNRVWDVNHQNNDGDTFAHILVSKNYVNVIEIIKQLIKNKKFIPNIKNNNGETILDKSITNNYIYTTAKILEDKRFNNIDVLSFKNLYRTYIKTNNYGKYTKLTNLDMVIDSLEEKTLMPKIKNLVKNLRENYDDIKENIINDKLDVIDGLIDELL